MVSKTQVLPSIKTIISDARCLYQKSVSITQKNKIPDTTQIPIEHPRQWLKIPDVVCVFVDMKGSTQLSASTHHNSTARTYQLYTGTAVKIFDDFDSPYIDVRGDGVLALFDSSQSHHALAAAVTFKTFAHHDFKPLVEDKTDLAIGSHAGIDMKTVLVRKIGYKRREGRSDRQNEVWGGKPVNMAAKLCGKSDDNELLVSDRFFRKLSSDKALRSCGCGNEEGDSVNLWSRVDLEEDDRFDFAVGYSLKSNWCNIHGKEYCRAILRAD